MRRILLAVFCCAGLLIGSASAAYVTKSGNITSDETWSDSIRVTGDITISSGATVVIEAGASVKGWRSDMSDLYRWVIYVKGSGALQINGTEENGVDFYTVCIAYDALTRDDDNWVKHCKFTSGWGVAFIVFRNTTEPTTQDQQSYVDIDNCYFNKGGYCAMYVTSGGSPTITNCYFYSGSSGLFVHGGGEVTVSNTVFDSSSCGIIFASMGGTKQFYEPMQASVDHCVFYQIDDSRTTSGITPAKGYGIETQNYPGVLTVTNSIFHTITNSGIRDWNIEDPNIAENWEINEDYNYFYNLGAEPVRLLTMGSNSVEDVDPKLSDPDNRDFSVEAGSGCVGAASDGGDIGLWDDSTPVRDDLISVAGAAPVVSVSANPFRGDVTIMVAGNVGGAVQVTDMQGNLVKRIPVNTPAAVVTWDGAQAGTGMYLLTDGNGRMLQQLVKID